MSSHGLDWKAQVYWKPLNFSNLTHLISSAGTVLVDDPRLAKIRLDRGYTYTDVVNVCPDKLPNFEEKIKSFYKEHIHYGAYAVI